ncbi:MAG: ATP-binding protein [Acidimicrobiia bacterium]
MSTGTVSREIETDRANPYVGPRSLRREDGIYGRNREIRELRASLLAHRILLLYSHSGAGKTSLIEAGLRPEFEDRGFQVFPTIRVGYEAPPDAGDVNRYLFSTLNSLEEGQQPEEQLDPTELAATNLDEYVRRLDEQIPDSDPLLIFDQFEELFTLDPTDWDDKREFLEEIGRMLEDRGRWALFAMREDFIAQLDPYVALIPTQLATRYRLELLKPSEAIEAIKQPASSVGVDFTDAAAEQLVNDLRRVQVQRGDRPVLELGPSVEPVQLQVVCHRVWASLPEDVTLIEPGDIADAGTVNEALAEFYETQVKSAADRTKADEYAIRTWFENDLITPDGFRTQVREGPNGVTDSVVQSLQSSHLIRSDRIRGAEWYELSHDRFVEPIQTSNAAFMRGRRRRRLRLLLTAVGTVLAAVILVGLLAWLADSDAPGATLGRDAEEVELGDTVSGAIEVAGDTSVYAFVAEEGETVLVKVFADGDLTLDVALLDTGEVRLAGSAGEPVPGEPEVIAMTSAKSGRYLITVTGNRGSTGEFELHLSSPDAGELPLDTPVSGSIADEETVAVHRIEDVAAGDSLVVRFDPGDELLAAPLELFGPNGVNLASVVALADGSAELVLEAPLDGAYLVTVRGSGGATGAYEIEQLGVDVIGFDGATSGEIENAGDITVFRFDAATGETALVTAVTSGSLNPSINLYDPSGTWVSEAVGFHDEQGEPWVLAAPTSATGAYHVIVRGVDDSAGEFELTVEQPEVEDLALNQPMTGSISDATSIGVHRLSASVGDSIVVRISPEPGFATARFELFRPSGAFLRSGTTQADSTGLVTLEAPENGSYLLTVGSRYGATGDYEIELVEAISLTIDQVAEGNVDAVEDITAFSVRANAGETVLITVVAPEGSLNPAVDLYDPLGAYVSTGVGFLDEPGEPWILAAPIATTGLYHVTVKASLADEQGRFDITVSRPEASNLPLETPVEGSVTDSSAVGVFRLNASAGDSIALRTTPDSDLATAPVSVFGPDGAFVASENSQSDGSGPPLIFAAPTEGSYLVTVSGRSGSTGDYEVTRLGVRRLDVGQKVQAEASRSGNTLVYSFDAKEGEIPIVTMVARDDAQPSLDLYDPDGLWVSSGVGFEEPGEPWMLPAPIATSGVHHLTASVDGPFELTLTRPPPEAIAVGESTTGAITDAEPIALYRVEADSEETFLVEVAPEVAFESPTFAVFGPRGWFISSGSTTGGVPGQMAFEAMDDGTHVVTVSGYQGSTGPYQLTILSHDEFETAWDVASLVPDVVSAEPTDYLHRDGGTSGTCDEWDRTGLVEEDSVTISPQFPLAVDHSVWAWAASFESGEGVASYLESYGEGCILQADPSIRLYAPTELESELSWYITTQQESEDAPVLLQGVGVTGSTDNDVVEMQLVLVDVDGFVREIEIDPDNPYGNAEALQLAEGLIEPVQARLSEMSP